MLFSVRDMQTYFHRRDMRKWSDDYCTRTSTRNIVTSYVICRPRAGELIT